MCLVRASRSNVTTNTCGRGGASATSPIVPYPTSSSVWPILTSDGDKCRKDEDRQARHDRANDRRPMRCSSDNANGPEHDPAHGPAVAAPRPLRRSPRADAVLRPRPPGSPQRAHRTQSLRVLPAHPIRRNRRHQGPRATAMNLLAQIALRHWKLKPRRQSPKFGSPRRCVDARPPSIQPHTWLRLCSSNTTRTDCWRKSERQSGER